MKFNVAKEIIETPQSKTIILQADGHNNYTFISGQYCVLTLTCNNQQYKRCYSFSCAEGDRSTISITVKKVTDGPVSHYLVDTPLLGQHIEVSQAYGEFNREMFRANRPIVMIAAGSGITPIYSMLKSLLELYPERAEFITLLYFNRDEEQTIFHSQLTAIAQQYAAAAIHLFATRDTSSSMLQGRLTASLVAKTCPDLTHSEVAICGPLEFMAQAEQICLDLGLGQAHIHLEKFNNSQNISNAVEKQDDHVMVDFLCAGQQIIVPKNSTLLDVAEKYQIRIANECGIGSCGECKVKLKTGTVDMAHMGGLNPVDERNGFILSCCSRVSTDIVIDTRR